MNRRTDTHTDRRTFRLIESIGTEGRCFENKTIYLYKPRKKKKRKYIYIHNNNKRKNRKTEKKEEKNQRKALLPKKMVHTGKLSRLLNTFIMKHCT